MCIVTTAMTTSQGLTPVTPQSQYPSSGGGGGADFSKYPSTTGEDGGNDWLGDPGKSHQLDATSRELLDVVNQLRIHRLQLQFVLEGETSTSGRHMLHGTREKFLALRLDEYIPLLFRTTVAFIIFNVVFIGYDIQTTQHDSTDTRMALLLIRCAGILPVCFIVCILLASRISDTWLVRTITVALGIIGALLLAYAAVSPKEVGYGPAAIFTLYVFHFTPIPYLSKLLLALACYISFVAVLLFAPPAPDQDSGLQQERLPRAEAAGVLLLFSVAIAYTAYDRELQLLRKHLSELKVRLQTQLLALNRDQFKRLLDSMLPMQLLDTLIGHTRAPPAETYDNVTVLFVYVHNFAGSISHALQAQGHRVSDQERAETTVAILHMVFTQLDRVLARMSLPIVHKVETVNETYLCVAGAPQRAPAGTTAATAAAVAIAFQQAGARAEAAVRQSLHLPEFRLQLRVGLHSGPVCAGITGATQPRWKLFGDTVNTASRMGSTCEPGCIHLSASTHVLLQSAGFALRARGAIPVKGKGTMETWYLLWEQEPRVALALSSASSVQSAQRQASCPSPLSDDDGSDDSDTAQIAQRRTRKFIRAVRASVSTARRSSDGTCGTVDAGLAQLSLRPGTAPSTRPADMVSQVLDAALDQTGRSFSMASKASPSNQQRLGVPTTTSSSTKTSPVPDGTSQAAPETLRPTFSLHDLTSRQPEMDCSSTGSLPEGPEAVECTAASLPDTGSHAAPASSVIAYGPSGRPMVSVPYTITLSGLQSMGIQAEAEAVASQPLHAEHRSARGSAVRVEVGSLSDMAATPRQSTAARQPAVQLGSAGASSRRSQHGLANPRAFAGQTSQHALVSAYLQSRLASQGQAAEYVVQATEALSEVARMRYAERRSYGWRSCCCKAQRATDRTDSVVQPETRHRTASVVSHNPSDAEEVRGPAGVHSQASGAVPDGAMPVKSVQPRAPVARMEHCSSLSEEGGAGTSLLLQPEQLCGCQRMARVEAYGAEVALWYTKPVRMPAHVWRVERSVLQQRDVDNLQFAKQAVLLCLAASVLILAVDILRLVSGGPHALAVFIATIALRFGLLAPALVAHLLVTRRYLRTRHPSMTWDFRMGTLALMVLMLVSILAASVAGGDPGFGVLSAALLVCQYVRLVPLLHRLTLTLVTPLAFFFAMVITRAVDPSFPTSNGAAARDTAYMYILLVGQAIVLSRNELMLRSEALREWTLRNSAREEARNKQAMQRLLFSILPPSIGKQLIEHPTQRPSKLHHGIPILFTDLKNFTSFAAQANPVQLVKLLEVMFGSFDRVNARYGLWRVELIGDAYFAVCGCPHRKHDALMRTVNAALEMLAFMPVMRRLAHSDISMRVGIHVGTVVAGTVGQDGPRYHVFGEAVNLANEMESTGVPDALQLSAQAMSAILLSQALRRAAWDQAVYMMTRQALAQAFPAAASRGSPSVGRLSSANGQDPDSDTSTPGKAPDDALRKPKSLAGNLLRALKSKAFSSQGGLGSSLLRPSGQASKLGIEDAAAVVLLLHRLAASARHAVSPAHGELWIPSHNLHPILSTEVASAGQHTHNKAPVVAMATGAPVDAAGQRTPEAEPSCFANSIPPDEDQIHYAESQRTRTLQAATAQLQHAVVGLPEIEIEAMALVAGRAAVCCAALWGTPVKVQVWAAGPVFRGFAYHAHTARCIDPDKHFRHTVPDPRIAGPCLVGADMTAQDVDTWMSAVAWADPAAAAAAGVDPQGYAGAAMSSDTVFGTRELYEAGHQASELLQQPCQANTALCQLLGNGAEQQHAAARLPAWYNEKQWVALLSSLFAGPMGGWLRMWARAEPVATSVGLQRTGFVTRAPPPGVLGPILQALQDHVADAPHADSGASDAEAAAAAASAPDHI